MIHINPKRIPLKDIQKLIDDAEEAQKAIDSESDPAKRSDLIKSHRQKWVAFRTHFDKLSHGKCWYTESKNPGTDDDVDHFRPKGAIDEDDAHGGYYWQALKWTNFRLSCHRANRLRENPDEKKTHGKGDHFPLFNPAQRAKGPGDDIALERPLLLDPVNPFDPPKLTFKMDGTVAVAPRYETNADIVRQVEMSRVLLHLDWPAFVDDRTQLYNQIAFKVQEGEQYAERAKDDVAAEVALRNLVTDLLDLTKEDRPYSAAASAYISSFRNVWWIRDVVLRIPASEGAA